MTIVSVSLSIVDCRMGEGDCLVLILLIAKYRDISRYFVFNGISHNCPPLSDIMHCYSSCVSNVNIALFPFDRFRSFVPTRSFLCTVLYLLKFAQLTYLAIAITVTAVFQF